jgi:hypothetical protein
LQVNALKGNVTKEQRSFIVSEYGTFPSYLNILGQFMNGKGLHGRVHNGIGQLDKFGVG